VAHDADELALVGSGKSEHAAHLVETNGVLKVPLGHQFDTQRIARHDYSFGNVAQFCPDVGSRCVTHNCIVLKLDVAKLRNNSEKSKQNTKIFIITPYLSVHEAFSFDP
jgi:hypothetical protein